MTFSRDITDWVRRTKLSADRVVRKFGLDAIVGVLGRSPVKTGRFRASNRVGINRIDPSVEPVRDEIIGSSPVPGTAGLEFEIARRTLAQAKFGDTLHITNNLSYGRDLENGSSRQTNNQPDGIYGATFSELVANADASIRSARSS